MCMECVKKYVENPIDNERVRAVIPLIADVYEHSLAGGGLHCLLDDFNCEDPFCEPSREFWRREELDRAIAEHRCGKAMLALTIEERASALWLFHYKEDFESATRL